MCTAKREKRQLISLGSPDQVEQKRREERISAGTELAATTWRLAGSSGRRGARTRKQQGRRAGLRRGDDDAWV
jgi:hypothetical protein